MKSVSIASLALVLALSGCASSPSVEEQTKLIEYEKCLNFASDSLLASRERLQDIATGVEYTEKLKMALIDEEEFLFLFEGKLLDGCEKYRP
jgi:hypothetical protein